MTDKTDTIITAGCLGNQYPCPSCLECPAVVECRARAQTVDGTATILWDNARVGRLSNAWAWEAAQRMVGWARDKQSPNRPAALAFMRQVAADCQHVTPSAPGGFAAIGLRNLLAEVNHLPLEEIAYRRGEEAGKVPWPVAVAIHDPGPVVPPLPRALAYLYCEAAPPRGVVEARRVDLDAPEGGKPVRVPLVWSSRMRLEWERHDRFERDAIRVSSLDGILPAKCAPRVFRLDYDIAPPSPAEVDAFGGTVRVAAVESGTRGLRCGLCGAWGRVVTVGAP